MAAISSMQNTILVVSDGTKTRFLDQSGKPLVPNGEVTGFEWRQVGASPSRLVLTVEFVGPAVAAGVNPATPSSEPTKA